MKANELMIGDWVYNNVADITFQVYPQFFSQWHNRPEQFEAIIQPIPLTKEILEKNGWISKRDGSGDFIYMRENTQGYGSNDMTVTKNIVGNFQMIHGSFNGISVYYVHELQHCLKLVGIDKEITI